MRLDGKTKTKIIEILAIARMAAEESALGCERKDETPESLKQRAAELYSGKIDWSSGFPGSPPMMMTFNRFHVEVERTAAAIFQAIEGEDPLVEMRRIQIETLEALNSMALKPVRPGE